MPGSYQRTPRPSGEAAADSAATVVVPHGVVPNGAAETGVAGQGACGAAGGAGPQVMPEEAAPTHEVAPTHGGAAEPGVAETMVPVAGEPRPLPETQARKEEGLSEGALEGVAAGRRRVEEDPAATVEMAAPGGAVPAGLAASIPPRCSSDSMPMGTVS